MKLAEIIRAFLAGLLGLSENEEETPKQPEQKQPTPEDIAFEQQFKMKQCLKRMEKNIQTKEAERAKAFATVQKHLRAGADQIARIYAKNVASLDAGIIRAHTQLSSVQILADKMNEGVFNAEAAQILGGMADAIQATSSVSDINTLLKNIARVEEIGTYLTDAISEGTELDLNSATEQIMIQAGTGVVTEPGMNSSGNVSLNAGEAGVAKQADASLKDLSDLINGKK